MYAPDSSSDEQVRLERPVLLLPVVVFDHVRVYRQKNTVRTCSPSSVICGLCVLLVSEVSLIGVTSVMCLCVQSLIQTVSVWVQSTPYSELDGLLTIPVEERVPGI